MILKQKPEDFKVKEVLQLPLGEGKFSYYMLKKRGMNTMDAVREAARVLGVDAKRVSYAGLKDKNAVTEQYISVLNGPEKSFKGDRIEIEFLGKGKIQVDTTILKGNWFEIVVRGLDNVLEAPVTRFPNYFDEQRFGVDVKNHLAGKALVKKDFLEACKLMGLDATKENCMSVLQRKIRLVKLCFSAYQSYIFNMALAEYIRGSCKFVEKDYGFGKIAFPLGDVEGTGLPLLQFDTEFSENVIEEIYKRILEWEKVGIDDFLIRQLPSLVSTTFYRDAMVSAENFEVVSTEDDEINPRSRKQLLRFYLPKGSYATMLIKYAYVSR